LKFFARRPTKPEIESASEERLAQKLAIALQNFREKPRADLLIDADIVLLKLGAT